MKWTLLLALGVYAFVPSDGGFLPKGRTVQVGNMRFNPSAQGNAVELTIESLGKVALRGQLGMSVPDAVGISTGTCNPGDSDECFEYGDFARLYITAAKLSNQNCATIEWYSPYARRLEDCYEIVDGVHWYGGGGPTYVDTWPIEHISRREAPVVPADVLAGDEYGGVTENYWLTSSGVAIHVDESTALWFSVNSTQPNKACFVAQDTHPYRNREEIRLKYDICVGTSAETFKDVHLRALGRYYDRPSAIPDERMLVQPLWSTWAQWHADVNQTLVQQMADRLVTEGFQNSSHVEIDDNWESCYGEADFNLIKFPSPKGMVDAIHALGLRVTMWIHPFINMDCPSFQTAFQRGYFVKDERNKFGMVGWWQGSNAGLIDFTNEEAVQWWSSRLERLQTLYGIDSYKFDAGEFNWLPHAHQLKGDSYLDPGLATTKYVEAVAKFGNLIEVRAARLNQKEPIFVRLLDKDSRFGYDNGLQSVIPTVLDFGLKGYSFVLPDMIGGNAYGGRPSKELYVRWIQVNSFMPSVQLSILPWDYDEEVITIVKNILSIRNEFADKIIAAAKQTLVNGSPMNRPMWWFDPTDFNTYTIDNQYMIGDDILVAPVVQEGAVSRDIYLPKGRWSIRVREGSVTYSGPITLKDFPAPLDFLPFFILQSGSSN
ncbi:unnamed protein product [Allacma fusca]|uniref:Uncharacterized protein n=1 Tax=Allacma fusca TaxID=39272 RepID=A0A8J2LMV0_9HEXA|nr:unnamed protein product [Allacma fusca]